MVDMSVIGMNTKTLLYTHAVMYIKESLTEWSQGEGKYEWWGEMWYQQQKERKIERGLHQVKVFLLNHKTSKTNLHKVCIFIQHNLQICCFLLCIIMNRGNKLKFNVPKYFDDVEGVFCDFHQ